MLRSHLHLTKRNTPHSTGGKWEEEKEDEERGEDEGCGLVTFNLVVLHIAILHFTYDGDIQDNNDKNNRSRRVNRLSPQRPYTQGQTTFTNSQTGVWFLRYIERLVTLVCSHVHIMDFAQLTASNTWRKCMYFFNISFPPLRWYLELKKKNVLSKSNRCSYMTKFVITFTFNHAHTHIYTHTACIRGGVRLNVQSQNNTAGKTGRKSHIELITVQNWDLKLKSVICGNTFTTRSLVLFFCKLYFFIYFLLIYSWLTASFKNDSKQMTQFWFSVGEHHKSAVHHESGHETCTDKFGKFLHSFAF